MAAIADSLSWKDDIVDVLAAFATSKAQWDDETLIDGAKRILIDTIAVGLGAFDHPAAQSARRYLANFPDDPNGATVWGTGRRALVDKAALVNGVLLRCYDYNDVMLAKTGAGHPSDMIAPLVALCEWRGFGGLELLRAIVVGYEVAEALHDVVPAEASGWDHANVSALGATCALGWLMGLTVDEIGEALGIAAIQHVQSNEIESSALNRRGDLTMWKRFHGADAMRHALDACLLAASGAEAPVRPFRGKYGFLNVFGVTADPAPYLRERLQPGHMTGAVLRTNLKRWPVGSRAQSAIASAIDARSQAGGSTIAAVEVKTEPAVYDHLVGIRQDPWHPISRETADHSLPYIIGAAVLDGFIDVHSFDLDKVQDAARAQFIAGVRVEPSPDLQRRGGKGHFLSEVTVRTVDGRRFAGAVRPGPGHADSPFTVTDLQQKLAENGAALIGKQRVERLFATMTGLEHHSVRELAVLLSRE